MHDPSQLTRRRALLKELWRSVVQTCMPKACVVKGALGVSRPKFVPKACVIKGTLSVSCPNVHAKGVCC